VVVVLRQCGEGREVEVLGVEKIDVDGRGLSMFALSKLLCSPERYDALEQLEEKRILKIIALLFRANFRHLQPPYQRKH